MAAVHVLASGQARRLQELLLRQDAVADDLYLEKSFFYGDYHFNLLFVWAGLIQLKIIILYGGIKNL